MDHQVMFAAGRREFMEIERTTTEAGTVVITQSCLTGMTEVGTPERYHEEHSGKTYDLHIYTDAQGAQWHVGTLVTDQQMKTIKTVGDEEITQVPAREWWHGYSSQNNFSSRRELLAFIGDRDAQSFFWEQIETTLEDATGAAENAGGFVGYAKNQRGPVLLDRTAYAAACAQAGVTPAEEDKLRRGWGLGGVYSIPEYSVAHVVWARLSRAHREWLKQDRTAQAQRLLAEVTAAYPGGSYSREQFEAASRAAGYTEVLDDADVEQILDPFMVSPWDEDLLLRVLALRRGRAMISEADQENRRCDECGTRIVGAGHMASLGLACSFDCFHAMSDRPGRYTEKNRP